MQSYTEIEFPVRESGPVSAPQAGWVKLVQRGQMTLIMTADGNEFSVGSKLSVVTKTANYTASYNDDVILCDATAGQVIITLPDPAVSISKVFNIKKTDSSLYTVRINPNGTETIDGKTYKLIRGQYANLQIVSDGSNWYIL